MADLHANYITTSSFAIIGDYTEDILPGTKIKANCGTDGYQYSSVSATQLAGSTTVITLKTAVLTSNLTGITFSITAGEKGGLPEHTHEDINTGGVLSSVTTLTGRIETAESDIDELEQAVTTNSQNINTLEQNKEPAIGVKGDAFNKSFGVESGTVCEGNDERLSDARKASDVAEWAKAETKPSYNLSEISETENIKHVSPTEKNTWNGKEPAIGVKGTAFNKNFGSNEGDVCQGNDDRLSDARTPLSHGNDKHSTNYEAEGVAASVMSSHTTNHPVPTTRDSRNEAAGVAASTMTAHTDNHPAPTTRDSRNEAAGVAASVMSNHTSNHPAPTTRDARNCANDDERLSDARPASDVSAWAKEATKPAYDLSEIAETETLKQVTADEKTAWNGKEPGLGEPLVDDYVLSSKADGTRSWVAQSGGGGTPGGADTQIQFNDGGVFGGSADMTFDKVTGLFKAKNISVDDGEFKIKTVRGMAGNTTLGNYFFVGAGPANITTPTGADNFGFGGGSLASVSSGYENVGFGNYTLGSNTTGYQNVAFGYNTLLSNVDGYRNVAGGRDCLRSNISGYENVAFGYNTMYYNTGGHQNIALGALAMTGCTNGNYNVAIGRGSMFTLSTGIENIAIGRNSFYYGNGSYNTIIGTTAGQNATSCAHNTAIGRSSMLSVTSGGDNTAVGSSSLYSNQTGTYNVALGRQSASNMTGSQNTVLGATAGSSHGTGSGNVFIGYAVASSAFAGQSNILAIHNSNSATPLIHGNFSTGLLTINGTVNATTAYQINGTAGADGSFTTMDGKTVTVTKGLITAIV